MKCNRFGGPMTYEKFYHRTEDYFGWRCIICGETIEEIILDNRFRKKA